NLSSWERYPGHQSNQADYFQYIVVRIVHRTNRNNIPPPCSCGLSIAFPVQQKVSPDAASWSCRCLLGRLSVSLSVGLCRKMYKLPGLPWHTLTICAAVVFARCVLSICSHINCSLAAVYTVYI